MVGHKRLPQKEKRKESSPWTTGVKENNDHVMSIYLTSQALLSNVRVRFWTYSIKILVFPNPTGYMLKSFIFFFFINLMHVL